MNEREGVPKPVLHHVVALGAIERPKYNPASRQYLRLAVEPRTHLADQAGPGKCAHTRPNDRDDH